MTPTQAAARQADHENLISELVAVVERYVMADDMYGESAPATTLYRDAKAVLAKAKDKA
ncbi:hypothetical protein [Cupriavidus basilensis]|uniref:hypothetical protein n=1 Tax=Cupriavidus basilensis TaxID=68895 RepID=UPI000AE08684|nr:hypothetical protein [Cupriavidus basilensis]